MSRRYVNTWASGVVNQVFLAADKAIAAPTAMGNLYLPMEVSARTALDQRPDVERFGGHLPVV